MCPDLESLENGVIRITEVGFEAGLLATYECNEGYTISSAVDATRICQLSGEWTGMAPTCISTYCHVMYVVLKFPCNAFIFEPCALICLDRLV